MENEATGNLASLKVKMQGGKEVKLENALEIMTSSFEKLTPSQQNDEIYVLKDRLGYIKRNSDTNQEKSSELLKAIEAYEKKFSQIEGKEITESPFQKNICQLTTAVEIAKGQNARRQRVRT
ncbi:hypothetical protein ELAC_1969 [Estrella lausannensis]|uniref:Uncharacterized protein n=2 Tax=Estrella lausannensis TaxID=483423 RepID=A0A0H5DRG8_9BACT|nr:hypothetical protein ELAC_1969 [Estrella lausannensis]